MSRSRDSAPKRQVPRIISGVFLFPIWLILAITVPGAVYEFYVGYYRPLDQTRTVLRQHFPAWLAKVPEEYRAPYEELYAISRSDKHHRATYDAIGVRVLSQLADGRIDESDAQTARALCTAIAQYDDMRVYHWRMYGEPGTLEAGMRFKELGAPYSVWRPPDHVR